MSSPERALSNLPILASGSIDPADPADPADTSTDTSDPAGQAAAEPAIATAMHSLVLLPETGPMLRSIFRDIERAERRVFIECYIVEDDQLGRELGEALVRAASRGVAAHMIYDPLGSQKADPRFFDDLAARGVKVRPYRPASKVFGRGSLAPRDHSRIMVVDSAAYTGGAAWADQWLPERYGGEGWHDVCVRVEGPIVEDFAGAFGERWREASGEVEEPVDIDTGSKYPDLELVADTTKRESLVYIRHREAIQRAKTRIWMENAYFFPSVPLLHDLYEAAARGVDVQIMVPGATDLPVMQRAARSEYAAWIDHGLSIWEYGPRVMHSKFAVIDDDWCTIGTFNANPTSLGLANEVNLFVFDPAFVARVARLFEADLRQCEQVTREALKDRPLLQRVADDLANNALMMIDAVVGSSSE